MQSSTDGFQLYSIGRVRLGQITLRLATFTTVLYTAAFIVKALGA